MDTNLVLGVAIILTVTNRAQPKFEQETCMSCGRVLRYQVIEQFDIVKSNVVPVVVAGRLHHLPVGASVTNRVSLNNGFIEHPAVYKPPWLSNQVEMPFPPLPPDPATIHREAVALRAKEEARRTNRPVSAMAAPLTNHVWHSEKVPVESMPRRSNTRPFVPPPSSKAVLTNEVWHAK